MVEYNGDQHWDAYPVLMTHAQAADALRVSMPTLRRHLQEGIFPGYDFKQGWRVIRGEAVVWLRESPDAQKLYPRAAVFIPSWAGAHADSESFVSDLNWPVGLDDLAELFQLGTAAAKKLAAEYRLFIDGTEVVSSSAFRAMLTLAKNHAPRYQ